MGQSSIKECYTVCFTKDVRNLSLTFLLFRKDCPFNYLNNPPHNKLILRMSLLQILFLFIVFLHPLMRSFFLLPIGLQLHQPLQITLSFIQILFQIILSIIQILYLMVFLCLNLFKIILSTFFTDSECVIHNTQQARKKRGCSSPPRKRSRKEIQYPPEIACLSDFAKEEWRLKRIYEEEFSRRYQSLLIDITTFQ